jgi:hypothetical protein
MKEDYLWDRTGSDTEIERLESLMSGLAFRPAEPPELPAREFVLEPARRGWLFRLGPGFGTAAAACLLLIAVIALQQNGLPVATVNENVPVVPMVTATAPIVETPDLSYQKISAPQRRSKPKKRTRREAKIAPAPQPRPLPVLTLTAEEADAYRQLMTALNITGTNLNIVRDKINGSED